MKLFKHHFLVSSILFGAGMAGLGFFRAENPHFLTFIAEFLIYGIIWYLVTRLATLVGVFGNKKNDQD